MAKSVNYHHFKTLLKSISGKEQERLSKCCCRNLEKKMKKDHPSSDELRKEVDGKSNEWKELSSTKK